MGPFNPSAPALGIVYFSSGCQSNGNNSDRRNPLNTTAQADPDQWKPDFASWFLPFFSHIPKSIFCETKNLPSPHTEPKLFSKPDPLSSSWHAWVSLNPRLQGEGGKPAFRLAAEYPSGGACPGGSSSEPLCKLLYSKPKWSVQLPKVWPQQLTPEFVPQHMWVWLLPWLTNPIPWEGTFTENASSEVSPALLESISVLIPHKKGPTLRGQMIYNNLWHQLTSVKSDWEMDNLSCLLIHKWTWRAQDTLALKQNVRPQPWNLCVRGVTGSCVLSQAAARGWRQDARVLSPCSVSIHHKKYPGQGGGKAPLCYFFSSLWSPAS